MLIFYGVGYSYKGIWFGGSGYIDKASKLQLPGAYHINFLHLSVTYICSKYKKYFLLLMSEKLVLVGFELGVLK